MRRRVKETAFLLPSFIKLIRAIFGIVFIMHYYRRHLVLLLLLSIATHVVLSKSTMKAVMRGRQQLLSYTAVVSSRMCSSLKSFRGVIDVMVVVMKGFPVNDGVQLMVDDHLR